MDINIRQLERQFAQGLISEEELIKKLLLIGSIDYWASEACGGNSFALLVLPLMLERSHLKKIGGSLWEQEYYVNLYARLYDKDKAIATAYAYNYKVATTIRCFLYQYYKEHPNILDPRTKLIFTHEISSNIDFETGQPIDELLHIWHPDYEEPVVQFMLIEDIFSPVGMVGGETAKPSLEEAESIKWLNCYSVFGQDMHYEDGDYGWGHCYNPLASIYIGDYRNYIIEGSWIWRSGHALNICSECRHQEFISHNRAPSRWCEHCNAPTEVTYGFAPSLTSSNPDIPVPRHLNEALEFLDLTYDPDRYRPWALNSANPGRTIRLVFENHPAEFSCH